MFSTRKVRDFLKVGMTVSIKRPVDISNEYEPKRDAEPGHIGKVKRVKIPDVRVAPGKERPYHEFVSVEFFGTDGRRGAVSYDNIQLLGFLNYLPAQFLDDFLLDMDKAHAWRWSNISETEMEVAFTDFDSTLGKKVYSIGNRYA